MLRLTLPSTEIYSAQLILLPGGGLVACWGHGSKPYGIGRWAKLAGKPTWTRAGEYAGVSNDGGWAGLFDKAAGEVRVFRIGSKTPTAVVPCKYDSGYVGIALADGGGELTLVYGDRLIVYALPAGKELVRKPRGGTWSAGYSHGNRWLVCPSQRAVRLFDREKKYRVARLPSVRFPEADAADPHRAVTTGTDDDTAVVWDLADRSCEALLRVGGSVSAVAVSADGQRVLTGTPGGDVSLWDTSRHRLKQYAWGFHPVALTFATDRLTAAVAGPAGEVLVWDLDD